jgi:hypothetical protein
MLLCATAPERTDGLKVTVVPAGAPVAESWRSPVKFDRAIVTVVVADDPMSTVAVFGDTATSIEAGREGSELLPHAASRKAAVARKARRAAPGWTGVIRMRNREG